MKASKENCRTALAALERLKQEINDQKMLDDLSIIETFLEAAHKRCPFQASFDRDQKHKTTTK